MKKTILTCACALGVIAFGAQFRAEHSIATPVVAAPDLPPPNCLPDCGPEKTKTTNP